MISPRILEIALLPSSKNYIDFLVTKRMSMETVIIYINVTIPCSYLWFSLDFVFMVLLLNICRYRTMKKSAKHYATDDKHFKRKLFYSRVTMLLFQGSEQTLIDLYMNESLLVSDFSFSFRFKSSFYLRFSWIYNLRNWNIFKSICFVRVNQFNSRMLF